MKFYGGRLSLLPLHELFYSKGNEDKFDYVIKALSQKGHFNLRKGVTIINEPIFDGNNMLLGGKLGKVINKKVPTLHNGSLAKITTVQYPYVMYLLDKEEQLILIEYNSEYFSNELSVFNYLSKILNRELWKYGLEIKINPLTTKGYFWELVKEADKVYSLHFILNSPNMLGVAYKSLKDILDHEKQESNANRIEFVKTNDAGELKVKENSFNKEAVGWTEDGAGEWSITIKSKKTGSKKKRIKNTEQLTTFDIEIKEDEIKEDEIKPEATLNDEQKLKLIKEKIDIGKHKIKGKKK